VPWQWGLTGIGVNTKVYGGDINTSAIFLDPPAELVGKINVAPEMNDVLFATIKYFGGELVHRRQGTPEEGARQAGRGQAEVAVDGLRVTEKLPAGDYSASTTGTAPSCVRA
jgi:spermidine/putrescine transport system substrate-binding protein